MEKLSVGIDLGTTNSCLAVLEGEQPRVVANNEGDSTTPSVVAVRPEGVVIGKRARGFLLTDPVNTFVSIKRKMGESFSRAINGREFTPESISAEVLSYLKACAEKRLGQTIADVVITVPANFNSVQRQATKDAGTIAGLNVVRVVNEPTAAALAYGHKHKLSSVMVVFDLGGGTFDVSVVEAGEGMYEVIYSVGDNHLGGDDFNMRVVRWIIQTFQQQTGKDIRRDIPAMKLVHEWAVAAKHALTDAAEVRVRIEDLFERQTFDAVLTRGAYETLCSDLLEKLKSIAAGVCAELRKPKYGDAFPGIFENQLQGCDILLVGGETRVPCIRALVQNVFKGPMRFDVNPDEVVALGAAIQAGIIHQKGDLKDLVLVDTTALSLGTEVKGGVFSKLIDANTPIPCTKTGTYSPVVDQQESVLVKIYQGESELCEKNVKLGEFEFLLQPPRPRVDAAIELTFHLDANDILHVSASDKKTGAKQSMVVKGTQTLDREKVEQLRREARQSQSQDRQKVRRIQRRHQLSDFLEEVSQRIETDAQRDPGNKFLIRTREYAQRLAQAINNGADEQVERAATELEAVWQKLLAAIPAPAPSATPRQSSPPLDDPSQSNRFTQCSNCGAQVPEGFAFCGKCGVPLMKENCAKCGAAIVEGFAFCGKCGAKI